MKNLLSKYVKLNSIRLRLPLVIVGITVPLILLLVFLSVYSMNVVRNQAFQSNKNMITLYMNQIDNHLGDIDSYLRNTTAVNDDIWLLESKDDQLYAMAKMRLVNKFNSDLRNYKFANSFFVYSLKQKDFFDVFTGQTSYEERQMVREYLTEELSNLEKTSSEINSEGWYVRKIGEEHYMFRIYKNGQVYTGAWVQADQLAVPVNLIHLGEDGAVLFVNEKGQAITNMNFMEGRRIQLTHSFKDYYISGEKEKYLIVGEHSKEGSFSFVAIIPEKQIQEGLPYLRLIVMFILVGSIIILPFSFILIRKVVLDPLNQILSAMKRIRDGKLEYRIEGFQAPEEFHIVNDTFNQMLNQVQELRIHVYEEQLQKQKAELQYLQLQLNPHFYLNSLNIIYGLAQMKRFEVIQELSLCLVDYFRFMLRSNLTFVSLKDEIKHVRNYLRIQELRFPNRVHITINVPEQLMNAKVPPLFIQTFVENSMKYGFSMEHPMQISISGEMYAGKEGPLLKIVVSDNGKGFSDEVLTLLKRGERIVDEYGDHLGVWNVQQRLNLLYEGRGGIHFKNGEPGATVEIDIPLYEN